MKSHKTTIFKQAIELGAQPLNDLTDKVTHLLALEPGSAKYKVRQRSHVLIPGPNAANTVCSAVENSCHASIVGHGML